MDSNICTELRSGIESASADATRSVGARLAGTLPADCTLALHGDLGVGKTTFVQGLAKGLGIRETITSPTFTLYALHRGPKWTLVHLDAYRLDNADQIENLMLEDFLVSPWCLAIEWPSRITAWLPPDTLHIELGILPNQHHFLKLRQP